MWGGGGVAEEERAVWGEGGEAGREEEIERCWNLWKLPPNREVAQTLIAYLLL